MPITPQPKKDLNTLTQLEKERELKKLRGETDELIDAMGQSDEKKAAPIVQQYVKEQQEKTEEQQRLDLEQLQLFTKNKIAYQRHLLLILERFIKEEAIPKKYTIWAESNDEGIAVGIQGTTLHRAIKCSGIPFYDANACKIIAVQIGNTVAKLDGYIPRSKGGIALPDTLDQKKYGK